MLRLLIGGARSGKSRFAVRLAVRKISGVTGDVIGGMQQIAELATRATGVALVHTFAIGLPWWTP